MGRNSTALMELAKNSYDADATEVTVYGANLDSLENGVLLIKDNGNGMTLDVFKNGFLRIASRLKDTSNRASPVFGRRFTGAKGIGRLSAHKLGRRMIVRSVPNTSVFGASAEGIQATILWDEIEKVDTIEDIGPGAITLKTFRPKPFETPGTSLELKGVRRVWSERERSNFFVEVGSFQPPEALLKKLPRFERNLFVEPLFREISGTDPGFQIRLEGDLASGEDYWMNVIQAAGWLIEVDALSTNEGVKVGIVPAPKLKRENPALSRHDFLLPRSPEDFGVGFQARILVRSGHGPSEQNERLWQGKNTGIRVYLEGFRVLPYGDTGDDWLEIDVDYRRRSRSLAPIPGLKLTEELITPAEGLTVLPNRGYFGAVFLTQERTGGLQMLVNREGFVPDPKFEFISRTLKMAVNLSVRVRASANQLTAPGIAKRQESVQVRTFRSDEGVEKDPVSIRQKALAKSAEATERTVAATDLATEGKITEAVEVIKEAAQLWREFGQYSEEGWSEAAFFRVLASIGTQMVGFVHEINSLLGATRALETAIEEFVSSEASTRTQTKGMSRIASAVGDLRRGIERQASYLTDVTSPDARRRRSRQSIRHSFNRSLNLIEHAAARRGVQIFNRIPEELRSPPMFPAELVLVFTNILSNAVKAATPDGKIRAIGGPKRIVRIENTGMRVDLSKAEKWFEPFQSTTVETDPILGQGMGMGLTLTRQMLEAYGAKIQFVEPGSEFSTAIEIEFPE